MNYDAIEYIRIFSNLSVIIPLVFYMKKINDTPIQNHIIGALIVVSGLSDLISYFNSTTSPIINNSYNLIQFILLVWFYYELVYKKRSEVVVLIGIGIYAAVLIFSLVKYGFFHHFTVLWSTASIIIVIHTFVYIFNVQAMTVERYFDSNLFSNMIFAGSIFCYFFVTFLIFVLADTIFKNHDIETVKAYWTFHNIFNILKNIGFGLAFYYTGKRKIYMTMEQLERIARKMEEEGNR
jgi:hypothetical protein